MKTQRIVILAGGAATRMKKAAPDLKDLDPTLANQADTLTKGMIGLGDSGKSLIDYQLENASNAGFNEVLMLLHPDDDFTQQYYEKLAQEGNSWGIHFVFARQHIHADRVKPAGTADAVLQALEQYPDWQQGRIVVCNSDNLYSTQAFEALWHSPNPNALISYDRDALEFPLERIKAFAIVEPDENNYLQNIIEKPSDEQAEAIAQRYGRIGVSMNAFVFEASDLFPALQKTPFHPVRNEKELPTALLIMTKELGKPISCIPMAENVPDLTSKQDILVVQEYLKKVKTLTLH